MTPKLLVKNLEEAGSRVVEVPLEESVKMRTAVKHVLTVAKSMLHLTVQITTRAGPVRIKRLRAMVAQDGMEDILIGDGLMECLGIDRHEKLATRLEDGTLEA